MISKPSKRYKEEGWLAPIQGQPPTARPTTRGSRLRPGLARKGRQMPAAYKRPPVGAVTHRGGACEQKYDPEGLSPAANRGSAHPRPVRKGAAPMEVPPTGAEPAVGVADP
ncbi:hypothetical protein B296_00050447 [Ensete ventricosum]|uniref:Uncharacterized protein n=1 Tax=Ensete ventricosum TaxID=4639 RepID=A0A426X2U3_ENSVE|nr:hypothetical protein B296_00050447 [Ensete ventricosum]